MEFDHPLAAKIIDLYVEANRVRRADSPDALRAMPGRLGELKASFADADVSQEDRAHLENWVDGHLANVHAWIESTS